MYRLKQLCEDFVVDEIASHETDDKGAFLLLKMEKKNYDTVRAVSQIAKALHVPAKFVGFAGNKDKKAITTQYITIKNVSKERAEKIELKDIKIYYIGRKEEKIYLGELNGNNFKITVRNLDRSSFFQAKNMDQIPNFFGEQRFSKNNKDVGRHILKGEFEKATEAMKENLGENESLVSGHLDRSPNDHVGAIRKLPRTIQKLYLHSFQSYLWNKAAEIYLSRKTEPGNINFPILGFDTEFDDPVIEDIYDSLMDEEEISERDFIIRKLPDLSLPGSERRLFIKANDFKYEEKNDELNKGKKKMVLEFWLEKGCYATTAIGFMFG